ncbi:hypothetical protein DFJ73DRAFT_872571, partial [Zopfochytrium polystomum]
MNNSNEPCAAAVASSNSGVASGGIGGPRLDDVVYLAVRGRRFCVSSAVLGHFPDSILMALFPSGLVPFFPAPHFPNQLPLNPTSPQSAHTANYSAEATSQSVNSQLPVEPESSGARDAVVFPPSMNEMDRECHSCRLPMLRKSVLFHVHSGVCKCSDAISIPDLLHKADHDLSRPFFDPESQLLELHKLEASKFVRCDLDPNLFAYVVASLRRFLLENESRRQMVLVGKQEGTEGAGGSSDDETGAADRTDTVSDGSMEDFDLSAHSPHPERQHNGCSHTDLERTEDTPALASVLGAPQSSASSALLPSPPVGQPVGDPPAPALTSTPSSSPMPTAPSLQPPPVEALLVLREETEFFVIPHENNFSPARSSSLCLAGSPASATVHSHTVESSSEGVEGGAPFAIGWPFPASGKQPHLSTSNAGSNNTQKSIAEEIDLLRLLEDPIHSSMIRRHCGSILANRMTISESFTAMNFSSSKQSATQAIGVPSVGADAVASGSFPPTPSPLQHLHLVDAIEALSVFNRNTSSWGFRDFDGTDAKLLSVALLALRSTEETDRLFKQLEARDKDLLPSEGLPTGGEKSERCGWDGVDSSQCRSNPVPADGSFCKPEALADSPNERSPQGDSPSSVDDACESGEEEGGLITQAEMDPVLSAAGAEIPPFSLALLLAHMQARRPVRKCWWERTKVRLNASHILRMSAQSSTSPGTCARNGASSAPASVHCFGDAVSALQNPSAVRTTAAADSNEVRMRKSEMQKCADSFGRRKSDPGTAPSGNARKPTRRGMWQYLFKSKHSRALAEAPAVPVATSGDEAGRKNAAYLDSEDSVTTVSTVVQSSAAADTEADGIPPYHVGTSCEGQLEVHVWIRRVWLLEFVGL